METINLIVSPSELDTMRQCPLRHQMLYHERWTKEPTESHPLGFGTLWHRVLEQHYKVIKFHQDDAHANGARWSAYDQGKARALARAEVNDVLSMINDPDVAARLDWMYTRYVGCWGLDPSWQLMATEFGCEVELPGPPGYTGPYRFRLKMKIDVILKEEGRVWIVDHKSCKNLPKRMELDLDDQFGLYHWGMLQLGYNVFGMIHNATRKEPLKTRELADGEMLLRTPLTRGKKELDKIALEAWQTAHERYRTIHEVVELRRTGLDIEPPRHPQPSQCGWKCDFTEACIAGRKGIDMRDYVFRKGYRQDRSRH